MSKITRVLPIRVIIPKLECIQVLSLWPLKTLQRPQMLQSIKYQFQITKLKIIPQPMTYLLRSSLYLEQVPRCSHPSEPVPCSLPFRMNLTPSWTRTTPSRINFNPEIAKINWNTVLILEAINFLFRQVKTATIPNNDSVSPQ